MKTILTHPQDTVLDYPECTMYGAVAMAARAFPDYIALDFMGKQTTYRQLMERIDQTARGLAAQGIQAGDTVTICMPNCPQAVYALYALNQLGAVASLIHPLSSQKNITFYLDYSESDRIITLDLFYEKVCLARRECKKKITILMSRLEEELPGLTAVGYKLTKGRPFRHLPNEADTVLWKEILDQGSTAPEVTPAGYDPRRTTVLLYSGGTTGVPKGICLSDFNFNALGIQIRQGAGVEFGENMRFLSVMPVFHGFGLGIGIHMVLMNGLRSILVPQFTADSYAKLLTTQKPNFIAGVPTLYEALLKNEKLQKADLSHLRAVFSGGDSLPVELKRRADQFLQSHGANIQIREGYGLTECVTASCVTPEDRNKEGSIGLPLRDMTYAIVNPGTFDEMPRGVPGEIILTGPTMMLGYRNGEEPDTIRTGPDGRRWLFTGDMGHMDEEGFIYFKQRIKRMIVTSGYNVYPSEVEVVLSKHPDVDYCCVSGVRDSYKMRRIRAYVVPRKGVAADEALTQRLKEHCKLYLDHYARPKEYRYRDSLPKTLVGKVAFHTLEEEAQREES